MFILLFSSVTGSLLVNRWWILGIQGIDLDEVDEHDRRAEDGIHIDLTPMGDGKSTVFLIPLAILRLGKLGLGDGCLAFTGTGGSSSSGTGVNIE